MGALSAMGWSIESTADPMAAGIAAARGGQDAAAAAGTEAPHVSNFGLHTHFNFVSCKNKQFVDFFNYIETWAETNVKQAKIQV